MTRQPLILTNVRLATLSGSTGFGLIDDTDVLISGERIESLASGLSMHPPEDCKIIDFEGRLVTPGLIDCHTHLVYAGSRANEFAMRLNGASYEEISTSGGGISSTVSATREASFEELLTASLQRLDQMIAAGTTTVEVKSGYGLDFETERRMLQVARQLEEERAIRVKTTFLGAHSVPPDMAADKYLDEICLPAMTDLAQQGLIDAVDGFCETIGFTKAQIETLFIHSSKLGLPVKLHAEQLSALGGSSLAARHGALSADHLEYATSEDVAAMAEAGTIAVLLPGAYYYLNETKKPPIEGMRQAHLPMAVATDCNPGTSPMTSLPLAMNMAATLFGLTPEETLRGVTNHAARALGLSDIGQLMPGQIADLAIWDTSDPAELTYQIGGPPLHARIFGGAIC